MTLEELKVTDLYELMDELDGILKSYDFNSKPHAYRWYEDINTIG